MRYKNSATETSGGKMALLQTRGGWQKLLIMSAPLLVGWFVR
jgi:hypothetical protein